MKKYIIANIIACSLASSNTCFSMLTVLNTQQRSYRHSSPIRMSHTNKTVESLSKKTIHNSSDKDISANTGIILENMYDRNGKIIQLLQKNIEQYKKILEDVNLQNSVAINHTYHGDDLNIRKLQSLENNIRKNAENACGSELWFLLFSEKKIRGYADE